MSRLRLINVHTVTFDLRRSTIHRIPPHIRLTIKHIIEFPVRGLFQQVESKFFRAVTVYETLQTLSATPAASHLEADSSREMIRQALGQAVFAFQMPRASVRLFRLTLIL